MSAQVDFVTGVVIGGVGIATLARVEHRRQLLLASLPLAFGLHQIAEGFVWLGLEGRASPTVFDVALHAYLFFAWALLPVLAPAAVLLVEGNPSRQRVMAAFVGLGAMVAGYLLWPILHDAVTAQIDHRMIRYEGAGDPSGLFTLAYVAATCGTLLMSSQRRIALFGVVNLAAVAVITLVQKDTLTSVWCFWAATTSVLIYAYFAHGRDEVEAGELVRT